MNSARIGKVYLRFIFKLNWSSEEFREIAPGSADLVDYGELELL